ncbi:MAG TPA: TonB-dependent receptor [Dyella sp.]|uniref:TonB-dependent receptor n=1 Tax=Dyella sp. TaxID=1869338 RepID=UPI002F9360F4
MSGGGKRGYARWLGLLPLIGAMPVHADDPQSVVTNLAPVVVVPTPLPGIGIDASMLPYAVQTLRYDQERDVAGANLVGVMNNRLTGININDVQGSPYQVDITFHGFRASPTLGAAQGVSVYLDGVRINEPFGDIVSWDMIPEFALESVTLLPGANPVFGPNTLGGALVLTTKSGLSSPGFDADISYGSYARRRVDLSYGVSDKQGWHLFVAGSYFDEDGWRRDSPGILRNGFLKFGRHTADDDWDVDVLHASSRLVGNGLLPAQRYDGDEGIFESGLYQADRRAIYTAPDVTHTQVTQLATHFVHRFDIDTQLTALLYTRHTRRETVNGDINDDYEDFVDDCGAGYAADGSPVSDDCDVSREDAANLPTGVLNSTYTRQQGQGGGISFSKHVGDHQFAFGVTFDRSTVRYAQYTQDANLDEASRDTVVDPEAPLMFFSGVSGSSRSWGAYATDTWALTESTHLTGSLRWNDLRLLSQLSNADEGTQPVQRNAYRKINPSLGLTHALGHWTLFANASQSNRAPSVIELGCADPAEPCRLPTGLQADPPLRQVVSRDYQLGVRWKREGISASASLFRTSNRDDILFLRAPNTQQGYFANVGRTRYQGADLDIGGQYGDWSWHVGYNLLLATYESYGALLAGEREIDARPGMRIAGLPRHSAKLSVDWNAIPRLTLGVDLLAMSDSVSNGNEDGRISDDTPGMYADWSTRGYALVNLRAAFALNDTLQFYARVDNVFDRRYTTYGAIAEDDLPDGHLIRPQVASGEAMPTLFVAPGAPRLFTIGMRLHF